MLTVISFQEHERNAFSVLVVVSRSRHLKELVIIAHIVEWIFGGLSITIILPCNKVIPNIVKLNSFHDSNTICTVANCVNVFERVKLPYFREIFGY